MDEESLIIPELSKPLITVIRGLQVILQEQLLLSAPLQVPK